MLMSNLKALAIVVGLFVAVAAHSARAASTNDIKIMSFNVRTANAADGANDWDGNRKNLVVDTIRNYAPDLLGIQEDLKRQKDFLDDELTSFTVIGGGSSAEGDTSGEYCSILYRTTRFTKLDSGQFWLSTTPDVPGSQSWGAALPRKVTWVKLRDNNRPDVTFVYMNTHWDHQSSDARFESAKLMRQKVHDMFINDAILVSGDFNADQGGTAYRRMTGLDNADSFREYYDSYREIHPEDSDTVGTAHGFDGIAGDGRIDWILHDDDFTAIDADIDRSVFSGRYPSDHFPITATLRPIPEPGSLLLLASGALLIRPRARRRAI